MPRHGTRARYRIEIAKGPDGVPGVACDRCKAANARAVADARAARRVSDRRAGLHIVDEQLPGVEVTVEDTPPADAVPRLGPMQAAIQKDLAAIEPEMQVPMHHSLSVLAEQLAKDFDSAESGTARNNASRLLAEVIKSLRTRREGDGSSALHAYLEEFGTGAPGLSGRRA